MATKFTVKDTLFRVTDPSSPFHNKVLKVCYKTSENGMVGEKIVFENPGHDCPLYFERHQVTHLIPGLATGQYREWYGNDEMTEGRFKNKGEAVVLVWGTEYEIHGDEEFIERINAITNRPNAHARYEIHDIRPYEQPAVIQFDDDGNYSF